MIKKFTSYFIETDKQIKSQFSKKFNDIKEKTIKHYSADKKYNFSCQLHSVFIPLRLNDSPIKKSKCHFKALLDSVFVSLNNNYKTIITDKEEFIPAVFSYINLYFSLFKGDTYKHFTLYQRRALTGYITYLFGFQLSTEIKELEGKEPSNELLSAAVRYRTPRPTNKKPAKK